MAEPTVYETNRRATALGLSFAQMKALDWLGAQRAPIFSRDYRNASITTTTMNSLRMRGLIGDAYDVGGNYWFMTDAGRSAVAGVPVVQAPRGLLQQMAAGIEALDAGHDPLCMAVLRGKECTCGVALPDGAKK